MNNIVMRKVVVTGTYRPLAATQTVISGVIACRPENTGIVYFKGDDGADVPWDAGEWNDFVGVNLQDFQIKGTPGDVVTVKGGTW
jgi:hypothetical protein